MMDDESCCQRGLLDAASSLTAKRINTDAPIDRWYPYYAGYSYQFATEVLAELCAGKSSRVLDPWNGSGTTTAAAFHAGHTVLGFDLNPATLIVASAKLAHRRALDGLPERLEKCLADMLQSSTGSLRETDPLRVWLPPRAARLARTVFESLGTAQYLGHNAPAMNPLDALVALCMLRAFRRFAVDRRSNPSWSMPSGERMRVRVDSIARLAREAALEIAADRAAVPQRRCLQSVGLGDARNLPVASRSVDVILTSPPYCTRIDYARQTSFEIAGLLGLGDADTRALRNQLMGTTTVREAGCRRIELVPPVVALLEQVRSHPSHRSSGYYFVNMRQYFEDAQLAIAEISRVLCVGGKAVLVLQNSFYKDLPIPLSELFCAMGKGEGLHCAVLARKPVTRSMSSVNTRARKYGGTRKYTEDVILMEKKL